MTARTRLDEATQGRIRTITLRNGRMNVLDRALQEELLSACREAEADEAVRAVLVRGAGEHFAAGADVDEMLTLSPAEAAALAPRISACLGALSCLSKPTAALLDGFALGGGLEIALAADRRIATRRTRVGLPEILLGVVPGGGGTQRLAELVGRSVAKDLVWTGRIVDAEEALALGIVDELVDDAAALTARGHDWADQLAAGPFRAVLAAKAAIDGGLGQVDDAGLALETAVFGALFETEDQRVGMRSFREHGPGRATFTGR